MILILNWGWNGPMAHLWDEFQNSMENSMFWIPKLNGHRGGVHKLIKYINLISRFLFLHNMKIVPQNCEFYQNTSRLALVVKSQNSIELKFQDLKIDLSHNLGR